MDRPPGGGLGLCRHRPIPMLGEAPRGHPTRSHPGTPWQTQKLYVDPDLLHAGLGRALMAAGETWMRARGAGSTWLVVYKGNDPAIRFYEALGFGQVGVEFHDFEELRVEFKLMEKGL